MTYQMKLDEEREEGRQEEKDKTVVRWLMLQSKRHIRPGLQDILDIAETADVSVERVRELAEKNGIDLA